MKTGKLSNYLDQTVYVKIDRPLGSVHPIYGFNYELNYGYVPDTIAEDGEALDAYILGINEPLREFTGVCIAVIERINDEENKLIIATAGKKYTKEDILIQVHFQEQFFNINLIQ